jgi:hypothetical protein
MTWQIKRGMLMTDAPLLRASDPVTLLALDYWEIIELQIAFKRIESECAVRGRDKLSSQ